MPPEPAPRVIDRFLISLVLGMSSVLIAVHLLAVLSEFRPESVRAFFALAAFAFAIRAAFRAWRHPTTRGMLVCLSLLCVGLTLSAPWFILNVRRAAGILDAMSRLE